MTRETGNRGREADTLDSLGVIAEKRGQIDNAERLHQQSLSIFREIGDKNGEAGVLINLGIIASHKGNDDELKRYYTEAMH